MNDQLILEHPDPCSLIVKKTKGGGLRNLVRTIAVVTVTYLVIFIFWYTSSTPPLDKLWRTGELFAVLVSLEAWSAQWRAVTREDAWLLIWVALPLFTLPDLVKALKISLVGEVFHFNGIDQTLSKGGRQRALFSDVRGVEIRTVIGNETPDHHRVSVLLNARSRLFVTESHNHQQLLHVAGEIARVLNTGVVET